MTVLDEPRDDGQVAAVRRRVQRLPAVLVRVRLGLEWVQGKWEGLGCPGESEGER